MLHIYLISMLCFMVVKSMHYSYDDCDDKWSDVLHYDTPADRVYYVKCVEEEWNYAPSGKNLLTGDDIQVPPPGDDSKRYDASIWLLQSNDPSSPAIGPAYIKSLYREYDSNCMRHQKTRSKEEEHLGSLGPNIRAVTGETIKVFFYNQCSFPASMHPHGVFYDKHSEGAPYVDPQKDDGDVVLPNNGWVYIWKARDSMIDTLHGSFASSKMWLYHSHVDEVDDVHAGLVGAIIVTQQGYQRSMTDPRPMDVSREFTTFFILYNENESHLYDVNVQMYLIDNGVDKDDVPNPAKDLDYAEGNLMHSINGYLFGNLDTLTCTKGKKVRWYTASFGNEGDGPHSPHWHGNLAADALGDQTDTVVLLPGTTYTTTMTIDDPGKWLYHCHVHGHIDSGMITTYTADDASGKVTPSGPHCCIAGLPRNRKGCYGITNENDCKTNGKYCSWDADQCEHLIDGDYHYKHPRHANIFFSSSSRSSPRLSSSSSLPSLYSSSSLNNKPKKYYSSSSSNAKFTYHSSDSKDGTKYSAPV